MIRGIMRQQRHRRLDPGLWSVSRLDNGLYIRVEHFPGALENVGASHTYLLPRGCELGSLGRELLHAQRLKVRDGLTLWARLSRPLLKWLWERALRSRVGVLKACYAPAVLSSNQYL